MWIFPDKYRLPGWLSIILIVGFLTTSVVGFVVSRNVIRDGIADQALPLTGDNIYSEMQKDILRPVFISSLMAQDTFLRDWIIAGEGDTGQIARYLKEVKQKYGTISSFLVSERTHKYYYGDGLLKTVQEEESRDKWYFRVRGMTPPYETNVDFDMANRDTMTIFINYKVLDYQGNFIGVTGVGLTLDTMAHIIDSYQTRFHRSIYFVNDMGEVMLAGKTMQKIHGSIRAMPGIRDVAANILNKNATPASNSYQLGQGTVLVNSRFIPELGWYLVVEENVSEDVKPIHQVFMLNLAISAIVTTLVLFISLFAVNRFRLRLEHVAATDSLTGLLNRQAFEFLFRQAILEATRHARPLSIILFDIDLFKRVNDTYGHLVGDRVLRAIAELARSRVRESDVVTRWGGEEFLILLKDCPLEKAFALARDLCEIVAAHRFADEIAQPVTISLGVAEYRYEESQSAFFTRADVALYAAKERGRNRAEIAD